jgi:Ca2+-transporting ATPase
MTPEDAAELLQTDAGRGLGEHEAARRLLAHGPNALPDPPGRSRLRTMADQFSNALVWILVAAAVVAGILGDMIDSAAIVAIVILNGVIGYIQERRAADALAALRRMTAPTARVRRAGRERIVPAAELVPGDVVVLEPGDRVPADIRLTRAASLRAVESALTGESEPVDKDAGGLAAVDAPPGDRAGMAHHGTTIAAGAGEGIVVATGAATEFGRIAELVRGTRDEETPLQLRLRAFGRWLLVACLATVALVFALGVARGIAWSEMLLTSISLAVAAVPEGLPAVVTIALAIGVHRMARRRAVVRRLASVETLGCATVICTDKTGTLTTGRMAVAEIDGEPARVLRAAVAASTARGAGDPTEVAIVEEAERRGIRAADVDAAEPVDSIEPFDAARKRMSIVRCGRVYTKGAPEAIAPQAAERAEAMARRGLRVLAVTVDGELAGLVGLHDPPRPEARASVDACRAAGIRPIMITGDHPRTAMAIAREIGIATDDAELATGPVEDVERVSVYARTSPEHKLAIVRAWKARGAVVAMTGDGVNDAPALRGADIGVAMGLTGTDVAKDASAMVIADDNFATIVSAVEEGRAVFENIRKALLYLLSGNLAEILVMALAVVAGYPLPFLPVQLLWMNLVTDGLPALALVADPADRDTLRQPPRKPGSEIADRDFMGLMAFTGLAKAACTAAAFLYGLHALGSLDKARAYAFAVLVMAQAFQVFTLRSRVRVLWELGAFTNARLVAVAWLTVALQAACHRLALPAGILRTAILGWGELAVVVGVSLVPVTLFELWKLARRCFEPAPPSHARSS